MEKHNGEYYPSDGDEPCPFCQSMDLDLNSSGTKNHLFWITCCNCGCEGPLHLTKDEASQYWNTRETA